MGEVNCKLSADSVSQFIWWFAKRIDYNKTKLVNVRQWGVEEYGTKCFYVPNDFNKWDHIFCF